MIVNVNSDPKTCNSRRNWNNKMCQCECKNYCKYKKDYSWNPTHVFARIASF